MESSEPKSAGQFLGTAAAVRACFKLADLEKNWEKAAGRVVSERTRLQSCSFTAEGLSLVVNVRDAGTLSSMRFKKAALERAVASYLSVRSVSIDFKIGSVAKPSSAKGPRPEFERRAPVLLTDEAVERERKSLDCESGDEITEAMARLKAVTERLKARKKR